MDGQVKPGWYRHPNLGLIQVYVNVNQEWVYRCYSESGTRALSTEKPIDTWTWALCTLDLQNR